jgi:uncharacterized protein
MIGAMTDLKLPAKMASAATAVFAFFLMAGVCLAQTAELQGLSFIKRLKLAKAGDDIAALSVGIDYETGANEARKDAVEAAKWYRKAALAGNIEAQFLLAKLIAKSPKGLPVKPEDGVRLLQSAADKGYAPAQNELGLRYQKGAGVTLSSVEAGKWFQKAADQKHVPAQVNLGLLLVKGDGLEQNLGEALKLFQQAADAGDSWGLNNLGSMYEMGWGVPKDLKKARELYKQSAEKGNAMAPQNLARLAGVE